MFNSKLKKLMNELNKALGEFSEAMHTALSESDRIQSVIQKINSEGFSVHIMVEGTARFEKRNEKDFLQTAQEGKKDQTNRESQAAFNINATDTEFLKSLHIKIDDNQ